MTKPDVSLDHAGWESLASPIYPNRRSSLLGQNAADTTTFVSTTTVTLYASAAQPGPS